MQDKQLLLQWVQRKDFVMPRVTVSGFSAYVFSPQGWRCGLPQTGLWHPWLYSTMRLCLLLCFPNFLHLFYLLSDLFWGCPCISCVALQHFGNQRPDHWKCQLWEAVVFHSGKITSPTQLDFQKQCLNSDTFYSLHYLSLILSVSKNKRKKSWVIEAWIIILIEIHFSRVLSITHFWAAGWLHCFRNTYLVYM